MWHNALYQAIEDPTVLIIVQFIYNMATSSLLDDDLLYEDAMTHLARWADLFDSLINIEDSVYWMTYKLCATMEVYLL